MGQVKQTQRHSHKKPRNTQVPGSGKVGSQFAEVYPEHGLSSPLTVARNQRFHVKMRSARWDRSVRDLSSALLTAGMRSWRDGV